MSSRKTLYIMEGKSPDCNVLKRLQAAFPEELSDISENKIVVTYASNIYELYKKLKNLESETDFFADIFEVLKENEQNREILSNYTRESFWQIFLFFDLDIHGKDVNAASQEVSELIDYFNDETENGKIYINYPMVEVSTICNKSSGLLGRDRCLIPIEKCLNDGFKKLANEINKSDPDVCRLNTQENWILICKHNYQKANWIISDGNLPSQGITLNNLGQREIFNGESTFLKQNQIASLGGFPFLLLEYLGFDKTASILGI